MPCVLSPSPSSLLCFSYSFPLSLLSFFKFVPPPQVLWILSTSFPTSFSIVLLNAGAVNVCSKVTSNYTSTHVHTHVQTDEQSQRDRRPLMTDTDLIWCKCGKESSAERVGQNLCRGMEVWFRYVVFLSFLYCVFRAIDCTVAYSLFLSFSVFLSPTTSLCLLLREKKTDNRAPLWSRTPGKKIHLPPRCHTITVYPWDLSYRNHVCPVQ